MLLIMEKLLKFLKKEMGISMTEEAQKDVASDLGYRSLPDFLQSGIEKEKYRYESNRGLNQKSPLLTLDRALNNNVLSYHLVPQQLWECMERVRPLRRVGDILDNCLKVYKNPFHEKETFTAMGQKIAIMLELQSIQEVEGLQSLLMTPVGNKEGKISKETIAEAMVKALHPELKDENEFNKQKEIYCNDIKESIEKHKKENSRN